MDLDDNNSDSPVENKTPVIIAGLSIVAAVLGGIALIIGIRAKGQVSKLESRVENSVSSEDDRKAFEDYKQRVIAIERALTSRTTEDGSLQSKVTLLETKLSSVEQKAATLASDAVRRLDALEKRGPATPPRAPQHPAPQQPGQVGGGAGAGNSGGAVGGQPGGAGAVGGTAPLAPGALYTVVGGDNFTNIARKFNVSVDDVSIANPGVDPTRLKVGQKLKIPAKRPAAGAPPPVRRAPAGGATPPKTPTAPTPPARR
jgi:hypothetical protein